MTCYSRLTHLCYMVIQQPSLTLIHVPGSHVICNYYALLITGGTRFMLILILILKVYSAKLRLVAYINAYCLAGSGSLVLVLVWIGNRVIMRPS